jgi:hypothetical protein
VKLFLRTGEASRMIASHQNRVTQDLTRNGLGAVR